MRTRGYITIATGDDRYYWLAENLLKSYLLNTPENERLPFSILTNKENARTKLFDNVIVVPDLPTTYMAKIEMLRYLPYDETIFIDADCLVYRNINEIWDVFSGYSGIRCIGKKLGKDALDGWFKIDDVGEWSTKINFCLVTHGGIMYIRRDDLTERLYKTCLEIIPNYKKYKFQIFSEPADETVLALSMAVNNCPPIERDEKTLSIYCFLAVSKWVNMNIKKHLLRYRANKDDYWHEDVYILHWQNRLTKLPIYYRELDRMDGKCEFIVSFNYVLRRFLYVFTGDIPSKYYEFKSFVWKLIYG